MTFSEDEIVLVSALNEYAFCPRRCAFKHVEKVFTPNAHTLSGTIEHQNADVPGYEIRDGVKVLRALSLSSEKLGLIGKADWVEMRDGLPYPVEMKHGLKRVWDNDDIQLCGQALCLEEMMAVACPMGAIYHSKSRHRREVVFDDGLRELTVSTIAKVRELLVTHIVPIAELLPHCEGCSLHETCMPEVSMGRVSEAAKKLFEPMSWT